MKKPKTYKTKIVSTPRATPARKRQPARRPRTYRLAQAADYYPRTRKLKSASVSNTDPARFDAFTYQPLVPYQRDLPPEVYRRAVQTSYTLFYRDPLASRIFKMPIEATQNAGVRITADDPAMQKYVNYLWTDPLCGFEPLFWQLQRDFLITGELNLPVAFNVITGKVDLAYIDPMNIQEVYIDEGNILRPLAVRILAPPNYTNTKVYYSIITTTPFETLAGEMFRFTLGKPVNAKRGIPGALVIIDWLEATNRALYSEAERWEKLRAFIWSVTLDDMKDKEIKAWVKENFPPGTDIAPSSVQAHNQKVKWEAVTPDLKAQESNTINRMLRTHTLGGVGMADWLFGFSENYGQNIPKEQLLPVSWNFGTMQKTQREQLTYFFTWAIQSAQEAHVVFAGVDLATISGKFKVESNPIFPRDEIQMASILNQTSSALIALIESEVISRKTSRRVVAHGLENFGIEVTAEKLAQEILEEKPLAIGPKPAMPNIPGVTLPANSPDYRQPAPMLNFPGTQHGQNPSFKDTMNMGGGSNGNGSQ
jgi:hypothetical protein